MAAKQAQGITGSWRLFHHRLIREWIPLWGSINKIWKIPYVNLWWVIIAIGFIYVLKQKIKWSLMLGWVLLYILGYSMLKVAAYWWYQLPVKFVLDLLFCMGIISIVESFINHITHHKIAVIITVFFLASIIFPLAHHNLQYLGTYQGDERGSSYIAMSQWFKENSNSSESIAFIEIGYLGFYTNNRIIDLAGLVLPDALPYLEQGDFSWSFWFFEPDYYVYLPDFDWALSSIRNDSRFIQQYQSVATLTGPRETNFTIYKRIDDRSLCSPSCDY